MVDQLPNRRLDPKSVHSTHKMLPSTTQSLKLRLSQQTLARRQAQVLANFMATQVRSSRLL